MRAALWAGSDQRRPAMGAGGLGRLLCEGGGDEGRGDAPAALAGMGKHIAHEVDAAESRLGGHDRGLNRDGDYFRRGDRYACRWLGTELLQCLGGWSAQMS